MNWDRELLRAERDLNDFENNKPIRVRHDDRTCSLDTPIGTNGESGILADLISKDNRRNSPQSLGLLVNPTSNHACLAIKKTYLQQGSTSAPDALINIFSSMWWLLKGQQLLPENLHFAKSRNRNIAEWTSFLGSRYSPKTVSRWVDWIIKNYEEVKQMATEQMAVEIERRLEDFRLVSKKLLQEPTDDVLRLDVSIRALTIARICVNIVSPLEGRTLSILPKAADLDSDERVFLDYLRNQADTVDRHSLQPLVDLESAIIGFNKDGSTLHRLAACATVAALCMSTEHSLVGLLARLQFAWLLRPVSGEYWFAEEMDRVRQAISSLPRVETVQVLTQYRDQVMPPCELHFACLMNSASAYAQVIATGESESLNDDYVRLVERTKDASQLVRFIPGEDYPKHDEDFQLLKAGQLAVGVECMNDEVAIAESSAFWKSLGSEGAGTLIRQLEDSEESGTLLELIKQTAAKLMPATAVG